jgi:very-short-patch-repair endonuclease
MRREPTKAERAVWRMLRAKQLAAHKFRRQAVIGRYIVDFVCHERCLVIEIDGGQHARSPRDKARTEWLESQGYRVLRFWNNDVLENLEGVRAPILDALDGAR